MDRKVGEKRTVYLNIHLENNAVNFSTIKGDFVAEYIGKTAPFNNHDGLEIETWRNDVGETLHVIFAHDGMMTNVAGIAFYSIGNYFTVLIEDSDNTYNSSNSHVDSLRRHVKGIFNNVMSVVESHVASRLLS